MSLHSEISVNALNKCKDINAVAILQGWLLVLSQNISTMRCGYTIKLVLDQVEQSSKFYLFIFF